MNKASIRLFFFAAVLLLTKASYAECEVGVRMIDAYGGAFEAATLQSIQKDLHSKGYRVFETNYSDRQTDLMLDITSDGISGGSSTSIGYTFHAEFISRKLNKTYAESSRKAKALIPYLTDVSFKKRQRLFMKVARDVTRILPNCDELD